MTTLAQSISDYIAYRKREQLHPSYIRQLRGWCKAFAASTGVAHVDELLGHHVHRWLTSIEGAPNHASKVGGVRQYLNFCRERYCATTPFVPNFASKRDVLKAAKLSGATVARWRTHTEIAAGALTLPHQRVIFLMGYLYGYQLSTLIKFTSADLTALMPMVRKDFYDLLAAIPRLGPSHAIFEPWLGTTEATARLRWRGWMGPEHKDVRFESVVRAGATERLAAGYAPRCGADVAWVMVKSLPPITKDGLERMRRWWDA